MRAGLLLCVCCLSIPFPDSIARPAGENPRLSGSLASADKSSERAFQTETELELLRITTAVLTFDLAIHFGGLIQLPVQSGSVIKSRSHHPVFLERGFIQSEFLLSRQLMIDPRFQVILPLAVSFQLQIPSCHQSEPSGQCIGIPVSPAYRYPYGKNRH